MSNNNLINLYNIVLSSEVVDMINENASNIVNDNSENMMNDNTSNMDSEPESNVFEIHEDNYIILLCCIRNCKPNYHSGGVIFIKFFNEVLAHFGQSFHLPLSLPSLYSMTGFNTFTEDIQHFVACGECHKILSESEPVPQCCNFRKLS
ncbi:hypothetical protein PHYBLDRAFT_173286 [Phycomyces blakesleeanus NRRL 1555(-)]|uniref:Uncharacterized protein n=1 Tax=Phycomyces blakesleeanus (strain ATCC 8743b / DSM 1359 / FGSC 10004 / NBRC 33097 / NRRL 1555) TaxID=763407 RepID=A0A163D2N7_PHYB8|nr:hypothetical protein PHYBLDRAFT_173286 [Phycomyces blakesleeanus NRRL 1555(-)]OAD68280.1 hypothetical protein PHYBLDRAFT_173286 [Phycomyces blakesleeanus NRRL 1555(-)]|eukprot:XP_018286320.1 hypothetical protein PHYBLDRAFT_173286 [Phycomyces blakesleeanus NRRL 1555(-)]